MRIFFQFGVRRFLARWLPEGIHNGGRRNPLCSTDTEHLPLTLPPESRKVGAAFCIRLHRPAAGPAPLKCWKILRKTGAVEWNRTTDPVLTKDVLCP